MTLINIDFGSLASSETMNKNFLYLDEKIADTADSINTSISSMLSNIATLNTRINDVSSELQDATEATNAELEATQENLEIMVGNYSMIPNWKSCVAISRPSSYTVPANGYLLLLPETVVYGGATINGMYIQLKNSSSANDFASIMITLPVKKGDVVSCGIELTNAYFVPVIEGGLENV